MELRNEAIAGLTTALERSPENSAILADSITTLQQDNFNEQGFKQFIKYAQMHDAMRGEHLPDIVPQYQPYY